MNRILLMIGMLVLIIPFAWGQTTRPTTRSTTRPAMEPESPPGVEHHEFKTEVPMEFEGKRITIRGGEVKGLEAPYPTEVYVSGDRSSDRQILLVHEWWGLNAHIKGLADQFADMGYRAYAVDLYGGEVTQDPETAQKLSSEAGGQPEKMVTHLGRALHMAQRENPEAKMATIGWCFGGGWSLQAALNYPDMVDACVVYYGQLVTDPEELEKLDAPVLGIFAEKDGWINPELVKKFAEAMEQAGKDLEYHIYDANHAFANPSGDRFKEKAARDAWQETLDFLMENL